MLFGIILLILEGQLPEEELAKSSQYIPGHVICAGVFYRGVHSVPALSSSHT